VIGKRSNLLSTSILAKDGITADTYATACMVMVLEKSKQLLKILPELEALFVYSDEQGNLKMYQTKGIKILEK